MNKNGFYTKKVIEYFRNPRNYGRIKNPDGFGIAGNPVCGDQMQIYLKIRKDKEGKEVIKDIKFETYGCPAAIATSSVITELVKGKTLEQAIKVKKDKIVKFLGGLPPIKYHCSILAVDAFSEAIYNYLLKNKRSIPKELQERHQKIVES